MPVPQKINFIVRWVSCPLLKRLLPMVQGLSLMLLVGSTNLE
jgi:hypothetical protein